eukprot:TRINITY_DN11264_c0_g1_i4.p3 TRINITY_DN11264_c0_g1~~TRINITY_DN11264_c0_g1_i4.p3  ORF type:complete len:216 (-),score=17.17 TRINITY_DN11264_c0_g1_i4:329-976(-)
MQSIPRCSPFEMSTTYQDVVQLRVSQGAHRCLVVLAVAWRVSQMHQLVGLVAHLGHRGLGAIVAVVDYLPLPVKAKHLCVQSGCAPGQDLVVVAEQVEPSGAGLLLQLPRPQDPNQRGLAGGGRPQEQHPDVDEMLLFRHPAEVDFRHMTGLVVAWALMEVCNLRAHGLCHRGQSVEGYVQLLLGQAQNSTIIGNTDLIYAFTFTLRQPPSHLRD